jgi:hypothetical protein
LQLEAGIIRHRQTFPHPLGQFGIHAVGFSLDAQCIAISPSQISVLHSGLWLCAVGLLCFFLFPLISVPLYSNFRELTVFSEFYVLKTVVLQN